MSNSCAEGRSWRNGCSSICRVWLAFVLLLQTEELETATEHTFIVSSQSPVQSELIANHSVDDPVFVEGGFPVWLRSKSLMYFVLQADCTDRYRQYQNRPKDDSGTVHNVRYAVYKKFTSVCHFIRKQICICRTFVNVVSLLIVYNYCATYYIFYYLLH